MLTFAGTVAVAGDALAANDGPRFEINTMHTHGAWDIDRGSLYLVFARAKTRPEYIDAAPYPQRPSGNDYYFERTGTLHGQGEWQLSVTMTRSLASHRYWNIGIRTGKTLHRLKIRVLSANDPLGDPLGIGGSTHHA